MIERMHYQSLCEAIERLIDKHSALDVFTALERVCDEKAEHIQANWGDPFTANNWSHAGKAAAIAARKVIV